MGYYTRVFCRSAEKPTVKAILLYLDATMDFDIRTDLTPEEAGTTNWNAFSLHYDEERLPILVECNMVTDTDELGREEIAEFIEQVEDSGEADENTEKVIAHLQAARFIIACQLPVSDIDDDGYDVNGELMNYFTAHYEGMVQADGEGFYDGDELLVELD